MGTRGTDIAKHAFENADKLQNGSLTRILPERG